MAQRKEERQVTRKKWTCHLCAEFGPEFQAKGLPDCTGQPLPGLKVDQFPVCPNGAVIYGNMEYRKHRDKLRSLRDTSGVAGRAKAALSRLISRFEDALPRALSGGATGVTDILEINNLIADFLAEARFTVANELFKGARKAVEDLADQIPDNKKAAVKSIMDTVESDLEPSGLTPGDLSLRDRRGYWGAAKRAYWLLVGNPKQENDTLTDRIPIIAGQKTEAFRRDLQVRQVMVAFGLPREQAETFVDQGMKGLKEITDDAQRLEAENAA